MLNKLTFLIDAFAKTHTRVDVVFDQYKLDSLKSYTREVRGTGERQKVTLTGHVPNNWESFLRNNDNKTELYSLLAKIVYTCSHEEADTRMFVHLKHALAKDIINTANDTDVVIIAISFFCELKLFEL